jgi:hypothetical protein
VLQEGEVGAGDDIVKITGGPEMTETKFAIHSRKFPAGALLPR